MPHWGCACGEASNWASRLVCRACGKHAPRSVADRAREAEGTKGTPAPAPSTPSPPSRRTGEADLAGRLAAEERRRKEAEQKLAALERTAGVDGGGDSAMEVDADTEMEALEPYEHAVRFCEREFGHAHDETKRARQNLDDVRRRRFAAKAPSQQLRLLEAKLGRRRKAHEALEKSAADAKVAYNKAVQAVVEDRAELEKLEGELAQVKKALVVPAAGTALAFAAELPAELLADATAKAELAAAEAALRAAQQAILAKNRQPGGSPDAAPAVEAAAAAQGTAGAEAARPAGVPAAAVQAPRPPSEAADLEVEWEAYAAGMDAALSHLSAAGRVAAKEGWLKVRRQRVAPF